MKVSVKFRIKNDIPFAIERVSGTQYRCGLCGEVFYSHPELEKHLKTEQNQRNQKPKFPELNKNITIRAIYVQDVHDCTNPEYPKLRKGDRMLKNE